MNSLLLQLMHGFGFLCLGALLAFLALFMLGSRSQEISQGEGCLNFIVCALLVFLAVVTFIAAGPISASFAL
jgi:hypothetical protein